ncbi:endonuclease III domain-containing protein [Virgibacillus alimentarius]|uniref:Endonuclease-3 related protein n=1 Tax=Virgibacillus alimentarius TaxID=698769 RepID=A0ABS4SBE5_9BACI|nr:endonuclease III domain-containing protein [Virgibacillus alimentarius]MBP2258436.1 endonuclease-3 related protein [Virgibacillus alimentarius]
MLHYDFIYKKIYAHYGPQRWWPADTAFEMMVGAILVQNTSWRNVEKALENVAPYLYPKRMRSLKEAQLAQLIRPSGFYNIKAKRLKAFLHWFRDHQFDVCSLKGKSREDLRKELLGIKGVGQETADVMLLYGFDKPVFVVDAYARRIFYRFGYDMPGSYDPFRIEVEGDLSQDLLFWKEFHALLVEHAKQHCKAKPICDGCPLREHCMQRMG